MKSTAENILEEAAERFGTPLYVYDAGMLRNRADDLISAMPSAVRLLYSVKANPNAAVLDVLRSKGFGAEVASGGELTLALRVGFDPDRIVFAGPGKSDDELRFALRAGILSINVESQHEAVRLKRIAESCRLHGRAAVRVNPRLDGSTAGLTMAGDTPFGVAEEEVGATVRVIRDSEWLKFVGFHVYAGTQVLDYREAGHTFATVTERLVDLGAECDVPVELIDYGPGLGVDYHEARFDPQLKEFGLQVNAILKKLSNEVGDTSVMIELGRLLVAEMGTLVLRVLDVKSTYGRTFVVADGGMNVNMSATSIGRVVRRHFPIRMLDPTVKGERCPVDVVGPLCTPLDTLSRGAELPGVEIGALLCIDRVGAYGPSFSPTGFLGHPHPAEVLTDGGKISLVRKRGTWEDSLRSQEFLRGYLREKE